MAITLVDVEETLFIPLWYRAQVSVRCPWLLYDPKAVELVNAVDYDFSAIDERFSPEYRLTTAARTRQCDDAVRTYIAGRPRASVVNLGAGLDTAFYRVDNGSIEWYDLDLPDVIAARKQLFSATDRVHTIAKSLLDMSWCNDLACTSDGVFALASAVLGYFDERQVKAFFSGLADHLPGAEVIFSAYSSREVSHINRSLQRTGLHAAMKWALEDANCLTAWDDRITVIDQFSYFRNIPYDPAWDEETIHRLRAIDERQLMSIIHVKV